MTFEVTIDGRVHTGVYRCECECGKRWGGRAPGSRPYAHDPAAPIAEAVRHVRVAHPGGVLLATLADRYCDWLERYWQRAVFSGGAFGRRDELMIRNQHPGTR